MSKAGSPQWATSKSTTHCPPSPTSTFLGEKSPCTKVLLAVAIPSTTRPTASATSGTRRITVR